MSQSTGTITRDPGDGPVASRVGIVPRLPCAPEQPSGSHYEIKSRHSHQCDLRSRVGGESGKDGEDALWVTVVNK